MIILDGYASLRLFAVGIKLLSILFIPVLFEIKDIALFSIILAAERFISFICSMEIHSYFNRKLIHRKFFIEKLNNQHIPIFLFGIILSILIGLFYTWIMGIHDLYLYIILLAVSGSIQNELIRRAQALSKINIFSILSAVKSTNLALSIIITIIIGTNDFFLFIKILILLSICSTLFGIYRYQNLCYFSIKGAFKRIKKLSYLFAGFSVVRNFIIQGSSVFSLAIIERTLILIFFEEQQLASHYSIQTIALASLILIDIFFWGPNYSKLISEFVCEKFTISHAIRKYSKIILLFHGVMIFSFLICIYFLTIVSNNWQIIIGENISWVMINIILIIIIPIDTFLTYFVHAKGIDSVNAKSGIIGLCGMVCFFLLSSDNIFIPFGIIIFYLVGTTIKFFKCRFSYNYVN